MNLSHDLDGFIKDSLNDDLLDINEYYNGKNGKFWVAIDDNDVVVGHIALDASFLEKNGSVELRRCSVDSNYRKHGIGKLLVEHFIDKAKNEYKAKHIFLTTTNMQHPAIRLYEKFDFRITNYNIEHFFLKINVLKMEKNNL
jgi:ribosomal protein S18 acetylase RimI-like enzyme